MRIFTFILLSSLSFNLIADQFVVFEKNGYFGIKDEEGQVTVPAVYEKLGWSDGSSAVKNGVIGYREGRLWGLISVKNKPLTKQEYYTIYPFKNGYIKASVKGRFSNQLFHGILDNQGNIVVSFHYFTIEELDDQLLVSEYESNRRRFGIVSMNNEKIIPVKYENITGSNNFIIARTRNRRIDLYKSAGSLIESSLDSLLQDRGWKCFRHGKASFVDFNGETLYPMEYKNFNWDNDILFPIPFPKWEIYKKDTKLLGLNADSLIRNERGLWIAYLNGANHLTLADSVTIGRDFLLRDANQSHLILEHSKTNDWSLFDQAGNESISGYDSMFLANDCSWAKKDGSWFLLDLKGERLIRHGFQEIQPGFKDQFIVKLNDHWGILDNRGLELSSFKFEKIIYENESYKIFYFNKWGIMNAAGDWIIRPSFDETLVYNHLSIGRKGMAYSIFDKEKMLFKTTSQPIHQIGNYVMVKNEDNKYNLLDETGQWVFDSSYDSIIYWDSFIELKQEGFSELRNLDGQLVFTKEKGIEDFGGYGDGYYLIKQNKRWGFIDKKGRLRISNRYMNAKPFSDGMAAVMIRNKWGFIDKDESLKVQPYYEEVGVFKDGVAIVKTGDLIGLIDKSGNEVLELKWRSIVRLSTGNYFVVNEMGKIGLVNSKGIFLLRPAYDSLKDHGNKVTVSQNGKYGVLEYTGRQLFKIQYKEITISSDFTLVKY